jgi:copper(I)-binding protein
MRSLKLLSAALVLAALSAPAYAGAKAEKVEITGGWFRALPAGLPAGGYFTLRNNSDSDIALTGAKVPACGMVMLHKSVESGGMGRMVHVEAVNVPAHGSVSFKPGGYHIMCMKPKATMKPGGHVAVTLEFKSGATASAKFVVKNATGN